MMWPRGAATSDGQDAGASLVPNSLPDSSGRHLPPPPLSGLLLSLLLGFLSICEVHVYPSY